MHGRMTRRHEGFVSTMLTESGLSIALGLRHFKCLVRRNAGCKPTSTAFRVLFVLTSRSVVDAQEAFKVANRRYANPTMRDDLVNSNTWSMTMPRFDVHQATQP